MQVKSKRRQLNSSIDGGDSTPPLHSTIALHLKAVIKAEEGMCMSDLS